MSTSKDGSKKISTATKTSSSKRESSTDRTNTKKKRETQKTKEITSESLIKISEEKPKKSRISTKVSSKPERAPSASSTKLQTKQSQKDLITSSRKVESNIEKDISSTLKNKSKPEKVSSISKKVSSKPEKVTSTSTLRNSTRPLQETAKTTSVTKISSKKVSGSREDLSTPSSSRIKKTQYFPSKNLYSNALKHADVPENILEGTIDSVKDRDKSLQNSTKTDKVKITSSKVIKAVPLDSYRSVRSMKTKVNERFLQEPSPESGRKSIRSVNVKTKDVAIKESSPDSTPSSLSERPRTATLRKGSIVNTNIVGPEVLKFDQDAQIKGLLVVKDKSLTVKQKIASPSPNSDDNYEDDFESYDSDFEAYSSSEDSTNLAKISGEETSSVCSSSEDIPEKNDLSPSNLGTESKKDFTIPADDERAHDSGTFELPDFKHKRILEHIKESVEKENDILKKEKGNLSSLSDEGFDEQHLLQFINFANAKKKCEKRRASQLRKKRGEEILGMIKLDNVNFTIFDSPAVPYDVFISSYGQNNTVQASAQTGDDNISDEVQTDAIEVQTKWTQMPIKFSSLDQNGNSFWINYKKEYMGAGDDNLIEIFLNKTNDVNEKRLGYFLSQSVDLISDILAEANIGNLDKLNRNERDIPFSDGYLRLDTENDIFMNAKVQNISVFSKNINNILTIHLKNDDSDDFTKSVISVWDISDLNTPRTILISYGEVCCATFSLDVSEYIFAGQKDGAILVWNIKEKSKMYDIPSRTPTFTTDIGSSHFAKVVSIQPIPKDNAEHKDYFAIPENNEICSLDEEGQIIIWNLYTDYESKKSTSDVVLISAATINLQDLYQEMPDLICTDFILLGKHVYVATSYGFILHCLLNINGRHVKKFVPATTIDATCIESCPFSSSFFLAGYSNGNIMLYSKNTDRPLMVLRNNEEILNTSVQLIQWSKTKPFVLYAKDSRNTIHIWDLSKSDMYPEYSIPFKENISCLKLSPVINIEEKEMSYMLIGTGEGRVYLYLLNKKYGQESYKVYNDHVATFLNYVSRL